MKKLTPYITHGVLAVVIVIFIVREMFNSSLTQKQALQLQSEKNRSSYLYKQLNESKNKEALFITERDQAHDLAGLYKMDIERKLIDLMALKSKIKQYEISDRSILYNTDRVMDSLYRARYPEQDSLYRIRAATSLPRP